MPLNDLAAQRVVVCGAGYTGQALARALRRLGKQVTVTDDRPAEQLEAAARVLADLEVPLHAGGHDPAVVCDADLVVISPGVAYHHTPALQAARERGLLVLGEVELAARLTQARVVGVTGTKGKTTTATLTSLMLDAPLANAEAYSARGVPLIELVVDHPDMPLVVAEMSSYQLESADQLRPWVAALLNIGSDHVERHGTLECYAAAKANIFRQQTADDRSVYCWDDPLVRRIAAELPTVKAAYSLHEEPPYGLWASSAGIEMRLPADAGGATGRLIDWADVAPSMRLQKPSLMAAATCALMGGASVETVRRLAREFGGLPHRMEIVRTWRELTFVNDSKGTNPLATENAIRQSPAPVVLIAGGLTKGIDLSPLVEPFKLLRGLVLIGRDGPLLARVAARAGVPAVLAADSLEQAVSNAVSLAQPGDWVVLSPCGASFDMFDHFADRGERFKAIVAAL